MTKTSLLFSSLLFSTFMISCGEDGGSDLEPECTTNAQCTDAAKPICNMVAQKCEAEATGGDCENDDACTDASMPICDLTNKVCIALPPASAIGYRDGSAESVTFTKIYSPPAPVEAPDLDFHPVRDELWVVNRRFEVPGQCTQATIRGTRCASLAGYTTIITKPGQSDQSANVLEDGNSWHFMRRPPSISMGANDTFATCGEIATGNFEDDPAKFMGPTLWSSNPNIYAKDHGPGKNGSHLDMVHLTPFCMGIEHEKENVYWLFNGNVGSIDRYDFNEDHGPGNADHSDAEVSRYAIGTVKREPNVPSHMEFNPTDNHLYIADTGNKRIVKLDTTSGTMGGFITEVYEALQSNVMMDGATMTDVVAAGTLQKPSGLAIYGEHIYVTDNETSKIHAFDMNGTEVRSLQTPLSAGSLAGIVLSPTGVAWFTDFKTGDVYRIDPK